MKNFLPLLLLGNAALCSASPSKPRITTIAVFTTTTATATITTGTASTSYIFLPGGPPASKRATNNETDLTAGDTPDAKKPPTATTITKTTTVYTTLTVAASPTTETIYPCAAPLPSPGPAYGDYAYPSPSDLGLANNLYGPSTSEGVSPTGCCNACLFEVENCVQAYWYSYEGCVVSQATNTTGKGTGKGVSAVCPVGTLAGLTYGPDVQPAFRSTGNIVGPCGVGYDNF